MFRMVEACGIKNLDCVMHDLVDINLQKEIRMDKNKSNEEYQKKYEDFLNIVRL